MEYKKSKKKFPLAFKKKWDKQLLPANGNLKPKSMPMFGMQKNVKGQNQAIKLSIKQ